MPDTQATVAEAAAIAAVAHALVARLRRRTPRDGPSTPSWRIEENRWVAARHGLDGDVRRPAHRRRASRVRERLRALLDELEPYARGARCAAELRRRARELVERQRRRPRARGRGRATRARAARWLADRFLDGC